MKNKCRPCLTITTIATIVNKHYKACIKEIKVWYQARKLACDMPVSQESINITKVQLTLDQIRDSAMTNYVEADLDFKSAIEHEFK